MFFSRSSYPCCFLSAFHHLLFGCGSVSDSHFVVVYDSVLLASSNTTTQHCADALAPRTGSLPQRVLVTMRIGFSFVWSGRLIAAAVRRRERHPPTLEVQKYILRWLALFYRDVDVSSLVAQLVKCPVSVSLWRHPPSSLVLPHGETWAPHLCLNRSLFDTSVGDHCQGASKDPLPHVATAAWLMSSSVIASIEAWVSCHGDVRPLVLFFLEHPWNRRLQPPRSVPLGSSTSVLALAVVTLPVPRSSSSSGSPSSVKVCVVSTYPTGHNFRKLWIPVSNHFQSCWLLRRRLHLRGHCLMRIHIVLFLPGTR